MEYISECNQFVAPSEQTNRLLVSSHALKIATHAILIMLQMADIRLVDAVCFGTKSQPHLFSFIDCTSPTIKLLYLASASRSLKVRQVADVQ